ncbi:MULTISPECIES: TerC family protein [Bradyrhizobium]|uniref:TerC family protein n=1 Tax=Bradyrhizobium TaxID=374 RepID=UPI001CD36B93|nr:MULTISPECIES: TerC family protein [Bradyrhizobium]MCA1425829.1 TerC family protein [Bradyrhizobium sp. NBAIM16]MCA1466400.1 TerC family protein [Bradyrhizobium sp. IC3195]MCA1503190.1 TerC family protein [Bradyrhizobium sp. NBAIM02]MCA1524118.1 TerC family protein [Bradyrhizobium yuanmingense]
MTELITAEALSALFQVILIDLVLAGDNAVVIGLAAAGLPAEQRRRAIIVGIAAATALRIAFAGVATQLLQVIGLLLAGGVLLLWVCWKMWRELREQAAHAKELAFDSGGAGAAPVQQPVQRKTFGQAAVQIVAADVSMSLDNVLAVAGAAREHPYILAFGLLLSVGMMGVAADLLGRLLQKQRWVAYVGLAIILYVAFEMIYRGTLELAPVIASL